MEMEMNMTMPGMMGRMPGMGMTMAFTTSCHVMPLLFNTWMIHTCQALGGACAAFFLLAMFYEGLKVWREHLLLSMVRFAKTSVEFVKECSCTSAHQTSSVSDLNFQQHTPECPKARELNVVTIENKEKGPSRKILSWAHIIQSVLHTIQLSIAYILMLVVMTFNVYLFLAVILGSGVGYFLFAWKRKTVGTSLDEEHCH